MRKDTDPANYLRKLESDQTLCSVIGALAYPQAPILVRIARLVLLIEHYWFWTWDHFRIGGLKAVSGRVRHRLGLLFTSGDRKSDPEVPGVAITNVLERKSHGMHGYPTPQLLQELHWSLDELIHFRGRLYASGWAFFPGKRILTVSCKLPSGRECESGGYGQESQDVERAHGPEASKCRFDVAIDVPDNEIFGSSITLLFVASDGTRFEIKDPTRRALSADAFNRAGVSFWEGVRAMTSGSVLEIGSRNRSGIVRKGFVPSSLKYTGFDILPGENVDVVGDAHFLSRYFPPNSFEVVVSYSVFEHLVMPWKVVIEINRVMKLGGIVMVTSHQTWPLHEEPWDFWRFSSESWRSIFNRKTGFQLVESTMGEQASIVPHLMHTLVAGLDHKRCYLGSLAVARKIGDTCVDWDVDPAFLLDQRYPT